MLEKRIRNKELLKKVVSPEVAASVVKDGAVIGTAGGMFGNYPKVFFQALAERAKKGEIKEVSLWTLSLPGREVDGLLTEVGILKRRLGSHNDPTLRKAINSGKVYCNDIRTEMFPHYVRAGVLGKVDVAVIDAVAITEEGHIVPGHTPSDAPSFVDAADILIVEINHAQPLELEGFHDIYAVKPPPYQREIPIYSTSDRVGTPYIPAGVDKITYIIESNLPEKYPSLQPVDEKSQRLAEHLIAFLENEVKIGRLPENLFPIETGIGSIADAIGRFLTKSNFKDLEVYTGIIGDCVIELIDAGKCKMANAGALLLSNESWQKFCKNIEFYKQKIILRTPEVTNHPEVIRRLGLIAINGAIEADIYGHINASHIGGTRLVNGVGGQSVFASNAYISIFVMLSTGRKGAISTIVPMVAHVDQSEHNVDVLVTEQGLADLRGLSPVERAEKIINNCAHPDYRPLLKEYLEKAIKTVGGHEPHILEEAFSFYERLKKTGTMKKS